MRRPLTISGWRVSTRASPHNRAVYIIGLRRHWRFYENDADLAFTMVRYRIFRSVTPGTFQTFRFPNSKTTTSRGLIAVIGKFALRMNHASCPCYQFPYRNHLAGGRFNIFSLFFQRGRREIHPW